MHNLVDYYNLAHGNLDLSCYDGPSWLPKGRGRRLDLIPSLLAVAPYSECHNSSTQVAPMKVGLSAVSEKRRRNFEFKIGFLAASVEESGNSLEYEDTHISKLSKLDGFCLSKEHWVSPTQCGNSFFRRQPTPVTLSTTHTLMELNTEHDAHIHHAPPPLVQSLRTLSSIFAVSSPTCSRSKRTESRGRICRR